jgi:hypothetical protein
LLLRRAGGFIKSLDIRRVERRGLSARFGASCLRFCRSDDRLALRAYAFGFRGSNLCGTSAFGLFRGFSLYCFLLGREALLKRRPLRLRDCMAILRQRFSRQNLERGRSRTLLPRDELVFTLAMLAKLSPPMPPTAAARSILTLLMRFSRGPR